MLVLCTMQSQNQAILTCLDAMDDTSKEHHGRLHAALNSKADSTKIARLDHQLEVMAHNIQDKVTTMIGGQLTSATSSIVDLKANLSHVTKCTQLTWNVWRTCCPHNTRAWTPIPQHTTTSLRPSKSASLHRPTPRTRLWLIPPSEGATAHRANFLPQSSPRDLVPIVPMLLMMLWTSRGLSHRPAHGPHRGAPGGQHVHPP